MEIKHGNGQSTFGPGVLIELTGDEVALAIEAYLVAHQVVVNGPRTIYVNGMRLSGGRIYVDPAGSVVAEGKTFNGRGA